MTDPWDHRDWYDLHDDAGAAGVEREPEHYREGLMALPPLGPGDHLLDLGAGTGKLAVQIAAAYPDLGAVTLLEPNGAKLERAVARVEAALPGRRVEGLQAALGEGATRIAPGAATLVTFGSVLMPIMVHRGGDLAAGRAWVAAAMGEAVAGLAPGGWLYALETVAPWWVDGPPEGPVRRLRFPELRDAIEGAGLEAWECCYRFRDRVVVRARRP